MFKFTHPNLDATIMDDNVMCYKIPPNSHRKYMPSPTADCCQREGEKWRTTQILASTLRICSYSSILFFPTVAIVVIVFACHSLMHYLLLPCIFIQWSHFNLCVCVGSSICIERCQKLKIVSIFFFIKLAALRVFFSLLSSPRIIYLDDTFSGNHFHIHSVALILAQFIHTYIHI